MLMDHPVAELAARTPTATLPRLRTASAERRSADAISAPRKPRAPLARLTEGAAGCADTHSVDGARLLAFSANLARPEARFSSSAISSTLTPPAVLIFQSREWSGCAATYSRAAVASVSERDANLDLPIRCMRRRGILAPDVRKARDRHDAKRDGNLRKTSAVFVSQCSSKK